MEETAARDRLLREVGAAQRDNTAARAGITAAKRRRHEVFRAAAEASLSLSEIAKAAGISKSRAFQVVKDEGD